MIEEGGKTSRSARENEHPRKIIKISEIDLEMDGFSSRNGVVEAYIKVYLYPWKANYCTTEIKKVKKSKSTRWNDITNSKLMYS